MDFPKKMQLNSFFLKINDRFMVTVSSRESLTDIAILEKRIGLLAISIKNPRFSNEMVTSFLEFSRNGFSEALITIVDKPYERNLHAAKKDSAWLLAETEKLRRIANETKVRINRMIGRFPGVKVRLLDWDELQKNTPDWLVREIREAWNQRGSFYRHIRAQTASVLLDTSDDQIDDYAEFMLEELPVLLQLYYFSEAPLADAYPGPQPDLFWKIESGFFAEQLPVLTGRLKEANGVIYLHWMDGSAS